MAEDSITDAIVDIISGFAERNKIGWKISVDPKYVKKGTFSKTIVIEAESFLFTDLEYLDDVLWDYGVQEDFRILPSGNKILVVIEVPPNVSEED